MNHTTRRNRPDVFAREWEKEEESRVYSQTLGKVTLLFLTVCYVITPALLSQTIISCATAVTVRSTASSPGGVHQMHALLNMRFVNRAQAFLFVFQK